MFKKTIEEERQTLELGKVIKAPIAFKQDVLLAGMPHDQDVIASLIGKDQLFGVVSDIVWQALSKANQVKKKSITITTSLCYTINFLIK